MGANWLGWHDCMPFGAKDPKVYLFALVVMMSYASLHIAYKMRSLKPKGLWNLKYIEIMSKRLVYESIRVQTLSKKEVKTNLWFNWRKGLRPNITLWKGGSNPISNGVVEGHSITHFQYTNDIIFYPWKLEYWPPTNFNAMSMKHLKYSMQHMYILIAIGSNSSIANPHNLVFESLRQNLCLPLIGFMHKSGIWGPCTYNNFEVVVSLALGPLDP